MSSEEKSPLSPHENLQVGDLGPRLRRLGMAAAVVGLGASLIGGALIGDGMKRFMHSLVIGFTYVLTFALGALFFVVLQHLVKARWSVVVRRIAEAMTHSFKPLAVVGIIIAGVLVAGYPDLYRWNAPTEYVAERISPTFLGFQDAIENDEAAAANITPEMREAIEKEEALLNVHEHAMHAKEAYLNAPFFLIRVLLYFLIWIGLARYFWRKSTEQDKTGDAGLTSSMRKMSAPAMILFAFTTAFASYDFLMSLEPAWFSTMFGVYYFAGSAVSIFALLALTAYLLRLNGRLARSVTVEHYHDIGKLLFAFVFFWGYVAFSQFMLIWYANIPEETFFFEYRWHNPEWKTVSLILLGVHFVAPFTLLMSRHSKRTLPLLMLFALWMLVAHWIDIYWLVAPNYDWYDHSFVLHWMDIVATIGMVGLFIASTAKALSKADLLPSRDPDLAASLKFENI